MLATTELVVVLAFIGYGLQCLTSQHMVAEFRRYGLSSFRILTGTLELTGGLGILVGLFYRPLLVLSSAGLAILMFLGVVVRLRVRDPPLALVPACLLMLVNLLILRGALESLPSLTSSGR